MFGSGNSSVTIEDILSKVTEGDILFYYLGITRVPIVINSPLRKDRKPSFGLYSKDGHKIHYFDFSTKERGGLFDLLGQMWNMEFHKVLEKINRDLKNMHSSITVGSYKKCNVKAHNFNNKIQLKCKIREWKDFDIEYWESYGITLPWLKYAEIYPISHKIVEKEGNTYTFGTDKYAYAYIERKEGNVSMKIYQPFNTNGFKWSNKNDGSVISLWTKVPEFGDKLCICSSVKDALCLWCNTGIPAIAPQGEGYKLSNTAINELKRRFKKIYILFDNDDAGMIDSKKLAEETGFINITLPNIDNKKDISDLFKHLNNNNKQKEFLEIVTNLFN